jgi:maltooligosyltrehalose trehalohydrolase
LHERRHAIPRRFPIGAEPQPGQATHFRVWAPSRQSVAVVVEDHAFGLDREPDGYFFGLVPETGAGTRYRYRLDGAGVFPDPASRFQPDGPHGASQIIDPSRFNWTDAAWRGCRLERQVIYEMHIGTFTREGTWEAASQQLPELASAGISVLEIMPVSDFPGRFGWGYDGVGLFAPTWVYGEPDDFRRFVNEAHRLGIGVILDVVYNHIGPDGNYLKEFSPDYFTSRYENEWGEAINFDGENSGPVREFFLTNAAYWTSEFHLDGLRLDATQQIFDASEEHILKAIGNRVRDAARGRDTILVAENESQDSRLARPAEQGGYALDALWNDDLHHSAIVALTGRNEAYYTDYLGKPQEFISAMKYGYLFQGQRYTWQQKRRGTPAAGLRPAQFVWFIQNHDQIANTGRGERVHLLTSPGKLKAMTTLLLLGPETPMLFQGQEFASSHPFFFFADHKPELSKLVEEGRRQFMSQFRSLTLREMRDCLVDPGSPSTFEACKLDFTERERHAWIYQLHKDLIRLRREDSVFRGQKPGGVDGAVLGADAFVLRFFGDSGDDRLLLVNLGVDLHLDPAPEPLLAPPEDLRWTVLWSSEDPRYGGCGTFPLDTEDNWRIPGNAAVALSPARPEDVDETGETKR